MTNCLTADTTAEVSDTPAEPAPVQFWAAPRWGGVRVPHPENGAAYAVVPDGATLSDHTASGIYDSGILARAIFSAMATHIVALQEELGKARESLRLGATPEFLERAHKVATDNDYCGVYDRMIEKLGLPGRPRTRFVDIEYPICVAVPVHESTSEADAANRALELASRDFLVEVPGGLPHRPGEQACLYAGAGRVSESWRRAHLPAEANEPS